MSIGYLYSFIHSQKYKLLETIGVSFTFPLDFFSGTVVHNIIILYPETSFSSLAPCRMSIDTLPSGVFLAKHIFSKTIVLLVLNLDIALLS